MAKLKKKDVQIGDVIMDAEGDLMVKTGPHEWKIMIISDSSVIFSDKEIVSPIKLVRPLGDDD